MAVLYPYFKRDLLFHVTSSLMDILIIDEKILLWTLEA
jgi:hypothetical protein